MSVAAGEDQREALERAQKRVPSSIDISLLGGGWGFLLEFSTVIVIIFTLLILGILKVLEGREIATILAAIAGYVLGKATSAASVQDKRTRIDEIGTHQADDEAGRKKLTTGPSSRV